MKLDLIHLILLLIPVLGLYYLLMYKMYDKLERFYVSVCFWGLYFYGGIGASSYDAAPIYTFYFIIFLSAFVFFYRLRYIFPNVLKNKIVQFNMHGGKTMFDGFASSNIIIGAFLLSTFIPLLYPEIKISNLLHPPAPEALDALLKEVNTDEQQQDILSKLIFYFNLLLLPLYYMALTHYKNKPILLFVLIMLPLYFTYCATEYIGRGMILMALFIWFFAVYIHNPKFRRPLIIGTFIGLPLVLVFFVVYSLQRVGYDVNFSFNGSVIGDLFFMEINYPDTFKTVMDSGQHVNFPGFVLWIATLPFPKFFLGSLLNLPALNYELAEIALGVSRNDQSYFVMLTGFISESYYVFGKYFFWVEAAMVAVLAKTIFYLLRAVKCSSVLILFVSIQFGFMYARAGLGAILPAFTNGFLAIYFYLAIKMYIDKISHKKIIPETS